MFTVIWGVDGFHAVDLMISQRSFNSDYFVSHVLAPMIAKVFPGGEFHTRINDNFTWITAESTFQRRLNNFSLKTIFDMCFTHVTVLILHHRISGFSVM
jgi:hypothetical protein